MICTHHVYVNVRRCAHPLKIPMLLKFSEELLSMATGLRASPSLDELLNSVPVLAVLHEPLQKLVVLLVSPFSFVEFTLVGIAG